MTMLLNELESKLKELSAEEQELLLTAVNDLVNLPKKNQSRVFSEIHGQKEKARIEELGLSWYYGY